jgi:predicted transcriptional regulator
MGKIVTPQNTILKLMRKGKKYRLMELVEKSNTTRQYVNFVLNKYIKDGLVKREGTRKWYVYYVK